MHVGYNQKISFFFVVAVTQAQVIMGSLGAN
jgi:hypothetical protein